MFIITKPPESFAELIEYIFAGVATILVLLKLSDLLEMSWTRLIIVCVLWLVFGAYLSGKVEKNF